MAATPSLKWSMTTPYEGGTHTWSFKTHFLGGVPSDRAAWEALWTDMYDDVLACFPSTIHTVGITGYVNDTTPAVFSDTADGPGTLTLTTGDQAPAYITALPFWTTDARNSRGGPIFLRNFFHGACVTTGDRDKVVAEQVVAINHWASKFGDGGAGYTDGVNVYKRGGPDGVAGLAGSCREFVSHRVLARRG